jgi:hypothetical protein
MWIKGSGGTPAAKPLRQDIGCPGVREWKSNACQAVGRAIIVDASCGITTDSRDRSQIVSNAAFLRFPPPCPLLFGNRSIAILSRLPFGVNGVFLLRWPTVPLLLRFVQRLARVARAGPLACQVL